MRLGLQAEMARGDRTSQSTARQPQQEQAAVPTALEDVIMSVLHRLRTPLTAIKGWNELLVRRVDQASRDDIREQLLLTRDAIIAMQRAIDEIAAERFRQARSAASPQLSNDGAPQVTQQPVEPTPAELPS